MNPIYFVIEISVLVSKVGVSCKNIGNLLYQASSSLDMFSYRQIHEPSLIVLSMNITWRSKSVLSNVQ
jgi:hypothetical protein